MSQENLEIVRRASEVKTFGDHTIAVPNAVPADAHGW